MNRAIVLLVLAWALSACGTDEEAATSNGDTASVATVNGTVISMDNVARRAEADQTSPRVALNALIDEELLYQFSVTEGFVPSGDRALDLKRAKSLMATPVMIDLRNIYNLDEAVAAGFRYVCIGRPDAAADAPGAGDGSE